MAGIDRDALPGDSEEEKVGVVVALIVVALFACFVLVMSRAFTGDRDQVAVEDGGEKIASVDEEAVSSVLVRQPTPTLEEEIVVAGSDADEEIGSQPTASVGGQEPAPAPTIEAETADDPTETADPASSYIPPGLDREQSSGNSQTGHIQLFGSGNPGEALSVVANGTAVGSTIVQEDGNWAADINLKPGDYTIYVQGVDDQGEIKQSRGVTFTVIESDPDAEDPTPPASPESDQATVEPATATPENGSEPAAEPTSPTDGETDEGNAEGGESIQATIAGNEQTGLLKNLLASSGLDGILEGDAPITMFAPTDEALGKLPPSVLQKLLENPAAMQQALNYHIVSGALQPSDIARLPSLTTFNNASLRVSNVDGTIVIEDTKLPNEPLTAKNGMIYLIDRVLLPASNIARPIIDDSGVPTFEGDFLTVVGIAEPGTRLMLTRNGEIMGETVVNEDGSWLIASPISPGNYELIAYTIDETDLPLAISNSIFLNAPE